MKTFLCKYEVRIGDTELNFYHLAEGKNEEEVAEAHEVEHDDCGLDADNSPIGGGEGEYCTELQTVTQITPAQKKFLNSIGIY